MSHPADFSHAPRLSPRELRTFSFSLIHWLGVDAYARRSWGSRLPAIFLATLILTALLWAMGISIQGLP